MGNRNKRTASGKINVKSKNINNKKTNVTLSSGILYTCFVIATIIIAILVYPILNSAIEPETFIVEEAPKYEGGLEENDYLKSAEKFFINKLPGPEAIVEYKGFLYVGLHDGRFVKLDIKNEKIEEIVQFGKAEKNCGSYNNEPVCGRPLGFRILNAGTLYIIDTYFGLFKVDLSTMHQELVMPIKTLIDGYNLTFLNDLDIDDDGIIYFSHSSSKWERRNFLNVILESKSDSRLISYNPNTNKFQVLIDKLSFANGVQLSPNKDFVLVNELNRYRIWKYYLKGSKAGEKEIFAENLPGLPDNIRASKNGGYWVGFGSIRRSGRLNLFDWLSNKPYVRKLIASLNKNFLFIFAPKYGLIAHINQDGKIDKTFHDPTGLTINGVSHVLDYNDYLYLGSYNANFLARVKKI